MDGNWSLTSWRSMPIKQQPIYTDPEAVEAVMSDREFVFLLCAAALHTVRSVCFNIAPPYPAPLNSPPFLSSSPPAAAGDAFGSA
jgi:hypothetical protein